ncbi:hypothetical protein D477_003158 [Arthrobacter crystallopoietes BAB-32]|uniref:HEAT repeat domain-containing protein n=1 Tax=Arthrobacter crystallopoietes BAB-32 TaxID=1246476 RepID=N1V2T5_9MICC|nr:hypothetical protein [Arthrobacter crystallopoietes]EMY35660.1 hypothetical protein D477_003158 [Arthrobacter crystallopoietes BAB-32]
MHRPTEKTPLRREAGNPDTPPDRMRELIHLEGNRADGDSDAGWCREIVAANPSAPADVLAELAADQNDCIARLGVAQNPVATARLVETLVDDPNTMVANAARERLGLPKHPLPGPRVMGGPFRFNPRTGRFE